MALLLTGCGGGGIATTPRTVSGNVGGLDSGTSVVLQNTYANPLTSLPGIDAITLGASDVTFTFPTALPSNYTYDVTAGASSVAGKTCTVANGWGRITRGNITDVIVTCGYTVSGTLLDGLNAGKTVVLQNNVSDSVTLNSGSGVPFTFASALLNGSTYSVTVATQPIGQTCRVANSSGTVSGVNVTDVAASCYDSGTLDASFGSGGIVVHDNAASGVGGDDRGNSIIADAVDKTLVAGYSWNGSNDDMVIWRYTSAGALDTSFGSGGIVVHNNAASGVDGDDRGNSIIADAVGRTLVAGYSWNGSNDDMVIWRYTSAGALDTSFGTGGIVVHNNAASGVGNDHGQSITLDASERILVTGYSRNGSGNDDMVIWRYRDNGTLDTSFGSGGIVVHNGAAGGNDYGQSITLDHDGRILVTGYSRNGSGNDDMVIWRYTSAGVLDTSFGAGGVVVHNNAAAGSGNDYGQSVADDSSERILVTGYSRNGSGNDDMVIWRYMDNGTLDTSFGSGGIVVHNNAAGGSGNDYGQSITLDANGKIVVTGNSRNVTDSDMVIWRYLDNGTLDINFGTSGIVALSSGASGNDYGQSITLDGDGNILVTGYGNSGSDDDMVIWRVIP